MAYNPRTIVLVNFGEYFEKAIKLEREPLSVAEIPLKYYKGFRHVAGYLSRPERTEADGYKIGDEDLEHAKAVADAFRKFPVNVKCEGEWGHCRNKAIRLVLPYEIDYNREEKKEAGGPDFVNQTSISDSSFYCKDCGEERKYQKRDKVLELEISFRLPYALIGPERREWNVDREELHRKFKRIAYQLKNQGIDKMIDPRSVGSKRMIIGIYDAQRIASRLAGCKEEEIPKTSEEYEEPRELRLHASTWDEWESVRQQMVKPKSHRPREYPGQLDFGFAHSS